MRRAARVQDEGLGAVYREARDDTSEFVARQAAAVGGPGLPLSAIEVSQPDATIESWIAPPRSAVLPAFAVHDAILASHVASLPASPAASPGECDAHGKEHPAPDGTALARLSLWLADVSAENFRSRAFGRRPGVGEPG